MPLQSRVVLVDAAPHLAAQLDERLRARGVELSHVSASGGPEEGSGLRRTDLAVVVIGAQGQAEPETSLLRRLEDLAAKEVATVVWGAPNGLRRVSGPLMEWLSPDVGLDEVVGRIGTLVRYAPIIKGLERELENLHRLGQQLNRHFGELDQEMRLAGRLQRDFLPRKFPDVPSYRFEALYRPASWVSGDMYDVFRIDEKHLGIFIADAMGHGVAAGLLTMFLRQALVAKQINGNEYTVVSPAAALDNLHQCLVRQDLPNCQFVTAAYAILDVTSGRMRFSRAGHPYPLHMGADGSIRELVCGGSLLGLADVPAEFEEIETVLGPGEKLVLYTDGIEDVVVQPRSDDSDRTTITPQMHGWARLGAADLIRAISDHINHAEGSLNPLDDVTVLVAEADAANASRS